jgi:hypothetical protein
MVQSSTSSQASHSPYAHEAGATTYTEALSLAYQGVLTDAVLGAMRNEILQVENAGSYSQLLRSCEVRINFGIALMQLGNQSPDPFGLYDESENIFLDVLKMLPGHEAAIRSLGAVQRNRLIRAGVNINQGSDKDEYQSLKKTDPKRFLTIGIPTVPRPGDQRYLSETLSAIIKQLPTKSDHPYYNKILVIVFNNRPGKHVEFDEMKTQIEQTEFRDFFLFKEQDVEDDEVLIRANESAWFHDKPKVRFLTDCPVWFSSELCLRYSGSNCCCDCIFCCHDHDSISLISIGAAIVF